MKISALRCTTSATSTSGRLKGSAASLDISAAHGFWQNYCSPSRAVLLRVSGRPLVVRRAVGWRGGDRVGSQRRSNASLPPHLDLWHRIDHTARRVCRIKQRTGTWTAKAIRRYSISAGLYEEHASDVACPVPSLDHGREVCTTTGRRRWAGRHGPQRPVPRHEVQCIQM